MTKTKLTVPAAAARPGPPLSPILGQAQIKVVDFVTQFNAATIGYAPGVPLPTVVTKTGPTKFILHVGLPTVYTLLWGLANTNRTLSRTAVWAVLIFRFGGYPTPTQVTTVLGTLRSARLTVR